MKNLSNELQLSKKSETFLKNLNVYLFSSGKNPDEIEEIVNELEIHLFEAEEQGKPIEKIIGNSPKEYMQMVSDEMVIDYRTWFKYIGFIILGSFSFSIFIDLWEGNLSYSVMEIIGNITIGTIFIISILIGFKYISTINNAKKQMVILMSIAILPMILFFGLIYLNKIIDTPVIYFGDKGSLAIGVIAAMLIIGISIWAKSLTLIIIMALLILPDYVLNLTSLQKETQLITSVFITYGGIGMYIWILSKLEKNN